MRRSLAGLWIGLSFACNSGISEDDASRIFGVVLDADTGAPINRARVRTAPVTDEDVTDSDGAFEIRSGVRFNRLYRVTAELDGYAPQTIDVTPRVDRPAELTFRLSLLTVCQPGSRRCFRGLEEGREVFGVEVCSERGDRYVLTRCNMGEVCDPEGTVCAAARQLSVTAVGGLVLSNPTGISCNPTCDATFPDGTEVTLTAQPFANGVFLGWSGDCADRGLETTCALTMSADRVAGAEFSQSTYPIAVDFRGDGAGEVRLEGRRDDASATETCRSDCTVRFDRETSVTLTATPDAGSQFERLGGACDGSNPCTVTLDDPGGLEIPARFVVPRQTLTVSRDGPGAGRVTSAPEGIDCGSECEAEFVRDATVTLTAAPEAGNEFLGWAGDCSGTDPTCEVVLDVDRSATATFDGQAFQLSVTKDGDGMGTVISTPSGIDCGADCDETFGVGQVVTLTATAAPGHRFVQWSGDCSGSEVDCVVTMDADRSVNATFEEVRLDVTVGVVGGGRVTSTPAGIDCPGACQADFGSGTTVELVAVPDAGQALEAWTGPCAAAGRGLVCTFDVVQAESLEARFTEFYRAPLDADMACRTLLRFEAGARLADACGGGAATETGAWTAGPSRTPLLADAYAPGAEGDALDLTEVLASPPRATVELTVRRSGAALGAAPFGWLVSDRDQADPRSGLELRAYDDGRLELVTWTSSTSSTSVATSTGSLPVGTWAHVAAVVAPSRLEIFVDGQSAAAATDPVAWTASSSTAIVGASRDGAGFGGTVDAELDEIRSSDVARY